MKLRNLEAQLVRVTDERFQKTQDVDALLDEHGDHLAHGVFFWCPNCTAGDAHGVMVWFRDRAPAIALPANRWGVSGTGLDDLTLEPSIRLMCWHGHVKNGEVT